MVNYCSKWVSKILFLFLAFVILFFTNNVMATGLSGVVCKAANLSQALNLGLGHNQNGANNNGTGNFFVVCPLIYTDINTPINAIEVGVRFPSGGGSVSCTARGQQFSNDTFSFQLITVTNPTTHGQTVETLTPNWTSGSGAQTNATLVCALGPGESIKWVQFRNI